MKPCKYCGKILYWQTNWAYEIESRIEYYEGCEGIVFDRHERSIVFADLLTVKPKYVTPRHNCPNFDPILKRAYVEIYDKGLDTLF